MLLDKINTPSDIKHLSVEQLNQLAEEIRQFLIENLATTGGHFGSNLGAVELTLALHQIYDSPRDKIIWDVGHQAYVHKILTGRKHLFPTLRKFKGMSGFPKRSESEHDMFDVGHASTSISAAMGYASARDIAGEDHKVIAVIGDGSMTGGMAFEALNHAGHLGTDMLVVLNDNEMSIAPNVGAISHYLTKLRVDPSYSSLKKDVVNFLHKFGDLGDKTTRLIDRFKDSFKSFLVPGMLFEEFGFTYLGPINGHDLPTLLTYMQRAKQTKGPVLLHVVTQKGKGYAVAADAPDKMHSVSKGFNVVKGDAPKVVKPAPPQYPNLFADTMIELAERDPDIVAITPAMLPGSGLIKFQEVFPERCFDVGIAEQHSATFAAGLACGGKKPVLAIYSTFLQRAYDQAIHDIAIQNLPVTIAIDRAGLVGNDGETHQGAFDIAFLRCVPNFTIMAPKDENEFRQMLYTAVNHAGPIAMRYPRGGGLGVQMDTEFKALPIGKSETVREGKDVAILALGSMVHVAQKAAEALVESGIDAKVVNMRFVKPLDEELLLDLAKQGMRIVTIEEGSTQGGMGSAVMEFFALNRIYGMEIYPMGLPDLFVEHGDPQQLLDHVGLNVDSVVELVKTMAPLKQKRA
ncbi:1-deoxy-D-xylulose-5-phosphate synthase [Tumebacillus sp. ITR2]|uniref:1-deoxy-D-xylulose-5-phosphate synthase n=1 Tax=Tumebacillus amylolyticus TaxID=2801339 RepID=A0ABS1JCU0_9BACL|nr:1-deoxy-D-xylulose-5-phosphate synthase [Tumebacillus amylolyticus]MBL0388104.1 1-deoxy-D-xylulose-5-phosphate synthase [Tumebacillus amylolyticus]